MQSNADLLVKGNATVNGTLTYGALSVAGVVHFHDGALQVVQHTGGWYE